MLTNMSIAFKYKGIISNISTPLLNINYYCEDYYLILVILNPTENGT